MFLCLFSRHALCGSTWRNSAQTHSSVISCLSNGEVLAPKKCLLKKFCLIFYTRVRLKQMALKIVIVHLLEKREMMPLCGIIEIITKKCSPCQNY